MNILELLLDLAWSLFHPPRPDNDRSIIGPSLLDRQVSRFWKIAGLLLLAVLILWAVGAWVMPANP
jgi:hypothetical protein